MPFAKAAPQQAFFKAGFYGITASGKTLTALLFAELLASYSKKRIAFIDTERGTDFYATAIPDRKIHPEAFDFDAIYTRSLMESVDALATLDTNKYGVVVIDSITHLWEAAKAAYTGKMNSNGAFPIQAWGPIKRPYKKLMSLFMDGQFHAIICGRQGVVMEKDEDGDMEIVGTKMKAEGETPYEPNLLFKFIPEWEANVQKITAFVEKDRSGILQGRTFIMPKPSDVEPMIRYLSGGMQGQIGSLEDAAEKDAAALELEEQQKQEGVRVLFEQIRSALINSQNLTQLKSAWDLTKGKKTKLGESYDALESIKDGRKVELTHAA
jgi:hypothetical protein